MKGAAVQHIYIYIYTNYNLVLNDHCARSAVIDFALNLWAGTVITAADIRGVIKRKIKVENKRL